jgi:hypothetical protein
MSRKQTYFLIFFLFLVWLTQVSFLFNNLSSDPNNSIRWFNDHNDRLAYMQDGIWIKTGGVPYRDVMSEYPQIPTYLFAIPFLLLGNASEQTLYFWHSSIFSFLMLVTLFFTIRMLFTLLQEHKKRAFLLLLPASLYFAYNRFDILPAFICLASFFFFKKGKYLQTGILLAIGVFTKWYPALLLPVFLAYDFYQHRRVNWKMIFAFILTCILIALPTILTAGWVGFLSPYRMHVNRGLEQVSLPALLVLALRGSGLDLNTRLISMGFISLQLAAVPLSLFIRIDTEEKLLHWIIIVTGSFVLFSQIFSPQWMLWLMPFLILASSNYLDLIWITLYNIVTYLAFPVGMDISLNTGNEYPAIFVIAGIAATLLVAVFVIRAANHSKVRFSTDFPRFVFQQLLGSIRKQQITK